MQLTKSFADPLSLLVAVLAGLPAQTPTRLTTGGAVSTSLDNRLVDAGGVLFFGPLANEVPLWKSTGTVASTVMVRPFVYGLWGQRLSGGEWHGELLFGANDGPNQFEGQLWRSNGTAVGTTLVAQVAPARTAGSREQTPVFVRLGGALCFLGSDAAGGGEPWRTDGTTAGTYRLRDINPGSTGSTPLHFTAFKGHVYFVADDGTAAAIWRTDGTIAGTQVFSSVIAGGTFLGNFAVLGDHLLIPTGAISTAPTGRPPARSSWRRCRRR